EALVSAPEANARWVDVPGGWNTAKKLKALERAFADFLYGNARLSVLTNRSLELTSTPGEDVLTFKARCRAAAHQEAEKAVAALKPRYAPKFKALNLPLPVEPAVQDSVAREVENSGGSLLDVFFSWTPFRSAPASPKPPAPAPSRGDQ